MPIDDGEAEDSGESTEEEEEAGASSDGAVELLVGATTGAVTVSKGEHVNLRISERERSLKAYLIHLKMLKCCRSPYPSYW